MGCFNATCAFTKTPIIEGENCQKLIFADSKPDLLNNLLIDSDYNTRDILEFLQEVVPGTYNSYGDLEEDDTRGIDMNNGKYRILFISQLSWEFSIKSLKDIQNKYNSIMSHLALSKQLDRLTNLIDGKPAPEEPIDITLIERRKIVFALAKFLSYNNEELFDFSERNVYAHQELLLKQRQQYQNLRQKRIDILKKLTIDEK